MNGFGEKLKAAREEKGLTPDQLAQLAKVNAALLRQWEDGRYLPEAEEAARLSAALECDLTGGETAAPAPAEVPDSPEQAKRLAERRRIMQGLLGLVAVLAACFALWIRPVLRARAPAPTNTPSAPAAVPQADETQFFRQSAERQLGRAYLEITGSVEKSPGSSMDFWLYTIRAEETGGAPCTLRRIEQAVFSAGDTEEISYTEADLAALGIDTQLPAGGEAQLDDGFPATGGPVRGIGLLIYAEDGGEDMLVFPAWLDFPQE